MRRTLALMAAVLAAALTGLILGEYELTLGTSLAAGLVIGLGLPELVLGIARWRSWAPAVVVAVMAGGSMTWAGWIGAGQGLQAIRWTVWPGAALAALLAGLRLRPDRPAARHRRVV